MTSRRTVLALVAATVLAAAGARVVEDGAGAGAGAGWERGASMSQRRSYVAGAELGGYVYAAGGMVGETGRPLTTFARYDGRTDRWQVLPQLPVATRAAGAASLGGRIYVAGGTDAKGNTPAVWAYDPRLRRWSRSARLPSPRFNHGVVALAGRLWVLGGFADGRELRDVLEYRPNVGRWRRATPLPVAMHAFGAVAFRGELWVLGGRRGERVLRDVWILDPATLRWRRGPAMPRGMELLGAAAAGDQIHAVWESVYQVYDAGERRWRAGPPPLVTRHALEAFVVDSVLLVIGGCTTALQDSPVVERLDL